MVEPPKGCCPTNVIDDDDGENSSLPTSSVEISLSANLYNSPETSSTIHSVGNNGAIIAPPPPRRRSSYYTRRRFRRKLRVLCSTVWLNASPPWIKGMIVLSSMVTVFSIVFLLLFIGLSSSVRSTPAASVGGNSPGLEDEGNYDVGGDSSSMPSMFFSDSPSETPSDLPSNSPSAIPTGSPSTTPSQSPSDTPSVSAIPSVSPSKTPSSVPSSNPSRAPSTSPSSKPSSLPSYTPSTSPSKHPTTQPSLTPTAPPTASPTKPPTSPPTTTPTTTPSQSSNPTSSPTSHPTTAPTPPTITTFFLTGDLPPTSNNYEFQYELTQMHLQNGDFFVHLGDFNQDKTCNETSYRNFSQLLKKRSQIPVFVIAGDNEWNDCPDPFLAWDYWTKWFLHFDEYWSPHPFVVRHQEGYEENFSFVYKQVLFLGVRIVGSKETTQAEWEDLIRSNSEWVHSQIQSETFRILVVFGHNNDNENDNRDFFKALADDVEEFGIEDAVYFHETGGKFRIDRGNFGARNLDIVSVKGGDLPFVKVVIDTQLDDPFTFEDD